MRRRWGRGALLGTLLAVGALVMTAVVAPTTASAVSTATMKGTVTSAGVPLAGVNVTVFDATTRGALKGAFTDGAGAYRLTGVPTAAPVKVKFSKATYLTNFAVLRSTWATATAFTLTPGGTKTLPNQTMTKEAVITGSVLSNMDPIDNYTISVYNADTHALIKSVFVAGAQYLVAGLPPVRIEVKAAKPGADPGWSGPYQLHPGEVLSENWFTGTLVFDLSPGGTLTGSVLGINNDPVNGWDDPLAGVTVTVLNARTGALVASGTTAGDGTFTISPVATDSTPWPVPTVDQIRVRLSKPGWVTLDAGTFPCPLAYRTAILDLGTQTMYGRPAIQGQVLSGGNPLGGARVIVYDAATNKVLASKTTDANGAYRIVNLPVTKVKVGASKTGYYSSYANDKRYLSQANVFQLVAGQTLVQTWVPVRVLSLDLTPVRAAAIGGRTLDCCRAGTNYVLGAKVTVWDATTNTVITSVQLAPDAYSYHIGSLPAVKVKIQASKPGFADGWASDSGTWADAAHAGTYQLQAGHVLGADLRLALPTELSGIVIDKDWHTVSGVTVTAINAVTGGVLATTTTDEVGAFSISGFRSFKVRFSAAGWVTSYAINQPTLSTADTFAAPGRTFWDTQVITPAP